MIRGWTVPGRPRGGGRDAGKCVCSSYVLLIEALLLALLGGAVGGALAYLYCDGASLSTLNFNTFSQVAFDVRVTPGLLARGLGWALAIGAAGGLFPAVRAARLPVTLALRTL